MDELTTRDKAAAAILALPGRTATLVLGGEAAAAAGPALSFYLAKGLMRRVQGAEGLAAALGVGAEGVRRELGAYAAAAAAGGGDGFGKTVFPSGTIDPEGELTIATITPVVHYTMVGGGGVGVGWVCGVWVGGWVCARVLRSCVCTRAPARRPPPPHPTPPPGRRGHQCWRRGAGRCWGAHPWVVCCGGGGGRRARRQPPGRQLAARVRGVWAASGRRRRRVCKGGGRGGGAGRRRGCRECVGAVSAGGGAGAAAAPSAPPLPLVMARESARHVMTPSLLRARACPASCPPLCA